MAPPVLWAVFTIVAATAQTFRNAAQKSLINQLGTVGATHVRFLFGLPFGLFALALVSFLGGELPKPNALSLLWTVFGAVSQIAATALMLAAMRERSFVVTIAYTHTEPIQIALFALIFLGETMTLPLAAAVLIATGGVVRCHGRRAQAARFSPGGRQYSGSPQAGSLRWPQWDFAAASRRSKQPISFLPRR